MDMIQRYHGAVMGRALAAAKALADTGIAYYNAQVARLNLQLDGYKTDAQVFETQVRAAVETVNVYRAQLEAVRVQGEIDRTKIETFRSQVAGVEALIGIYKTTVEAARVKADIEKLKLQAYQESVAAYVAMVQAKSVELNAVERSQVRIEQKLLLAQHHDALRDRLQREKLRGAHRSIFLNGSPEPRPYRAYP